MRVAAQVARVGPMLARRTAKAVAQGEVTVPTEGPGTELKSLFGELGLVGKGCGSCNDRAWLMNVWGAQGCREHRDEILGWLREQQAKLGWLETLAAGARLATVSLVHQVGPAGVASWLVDELIRRAEAK